MVTGVRIVNACDRIVKQHKLKPASSLPIRSVVREMELVLEHGSQLYREQTKFLANLESFRQEARNSQINIRRDPRESADLRIERDTKDHRLFLTLMQIEAQKRETYTTFDPMLRSIEMKLAELLTEYEHLSMGHGNS